MNSQNVRWRQWGESGVVAGGWMPKAEMHKHLRAFELKAKELLKETGADHVVYGVKYFDADGNLKKITFYQKPMSESEFESTVAKMTNVQVYALHRMPSTKVIGYEKAKNLMRQLDWKMRVTMLGESVERIELYHPNQQNVYTVRMDSGRKLMAECRVIGKGRYDTEAILCYDHDGSNESVV